MKTIAIISLIVTAGVIVALSACVPTVLSQNKFLQGFVTHEILGMMAVIMTISMTTIATIHIWFNELEARHQQRVFGKARKEINLSIFYFIWIFVAQLVVLIVRSLPDLENNDVAISLFNGLSIILLLCAVFTLMDIMGVVRSLTPED
jgi:hypothetical protein